LLSFLVVSSGQLDLGDQGSGIALERIKGSKIPYVGPIILEGRRRRSLQIHCRRSSSTTLFATSRCGRKCKAVALIVWRRNDRATSGASPAISETVGYWRSNLETVVYWRGKFESDSGRQRPDRRRMSGPHRVSQSVSSFGLPTPDRRMALMRNYYRLGKRNNAFSVGKRNRSLDNVLFTDN